MISIPFRRGLVVAALLLGAQAIAVPVSAQEDAAAIARGGRLYDRFWGENKAAKPTTDHQAYPHKGGQYGKDVSWRCKECHGWDYLGKDGAYSSGGHATGIKGINGAAGRDPAAIAALLRAAPHGYTEAQLSARDVSDLALFVSKGQVDMMKFLDYPAKKARGDVAKGKTYFTTLCAGCHGDDGKKVQGAPPLGSIQNPQEMLHKVINGQPGEAMPSLRALDTQISVDLVAFMLTLPQR
ncbi:MAG: c-type cytochrome [Alphaproteobacteria bacterium]|nr:c-type cytochrome [Alphaproteobacteria bacterium]